MSLNFFCILRVVFFFTGSVVLVPDVLAKSQEPSSAVGKQALELIIEVDKCKVAEAALSEQWKVYGSNDAEERIQEWYEEKGYKKSSVRNLAYKFYNLDKLQRLAIKGDLDAVRFLGDIQDNRARGIFWANKGVLDAKTFSEMEVLYVQAAAYGSTKSIYEIGELTYKFKLKDLSASMLNADERQMREREGWIAVLSWYKLAKFRGDRFRLEVVDNWLKSANVTLTLEDWNKVTANVKALYANLQAHRLALGGGKFDDAEPEFIKAFYDSFLCKVNPELLK